MNILFFFIYSILKMSDSNNDTGNDAGNDAGNTSGNTSGNASGNTSGNASGNTSNNSSSNSYDNSAFSTTFNINRCSNENISNPGYIGLDMETGVIPTKYYTQPVCNILGGTFTAVTSPNPEFNYQHNLGTCTSPTINFSSLCAYLPSENAFSRLTGNVTSANSRFYGAPICNSNDEMLMIDPNNSLIVRCVKQPLSTNPTI